jgi:hypothetical protein
MVEVSYKQHTVLLMSGANDKAWDHSAARNEVPPQRMR